MKKKLLAVAVLMGALQGPAHAQIPTVDIAAIAQMGSQLQQMKQQYEQMRSQYDAFNGSRGMSSLLQNSSLRKYLPQDWKSVYDQVQQGQYSGLSGNIGAIKSANSVLSAQQLQGLHSSNAASLDRQRNNAAVAQGTAEEAYRRTGDRIDYLQSLATQVESAQDPKAVMDLQASIAAEQAMIQNEQIRLQLTAQLVAARDRQEAMREREEFLQTTGSNPARIK